MNWRKPILVLLLTLGLLVPFLLFLNRFLVPDYSMDTMVYHLFNAYRAWHPEIREFYPVGIHNYPVILDGLNMILISILGYRLGSVGSLAAFYLCIFVLYKIYKLYFPKIKILSDWRVCLIFIGLFMSSEAFLLLATYYTDITSMLIVLLAMYCLFVFEKRGNVIWLLMSNFLFGLSLAAKMTNLYLALSYFGYVGYLLLNRNDYSRRKKIKLFLISLILGISLIFPWWTTNYHQTKNPVFPSFNTIFNSPYYPSKNFTLTSYGFGGINWREKFGWAAVSFFQPERLGQWQPGEKDYKINFYFFTTLIIFIYSLIKREKKIFFLSCFYLVSYWCWSWFFGYSRYSLFLDFFGGLLMLMFFTENRNLFKNIFMSLTLLFLFWSGYRTIRVALYHDISFRKMFIHESTSYLKELKHFKINSIAVNSNLKPDIYINCSVSVLGYHVLSPFRDLPVVNIEQKFNDYVTNNNNYKNRVEQNIGNIKGKNFVTITAYKGFNQEEYDLCIENLKKANATINYEEQTNFLGYEDRQLKIIYGEFR